MPAFAALRAIVAARQGNDAASAWFAREALDAGRAVDNPMIVGRVLQRTALAAFYREDFDEAQDRALEAARWYERFESHRNAAMSYSILYVIAHDWAGDPDVARFYARRMTMSAHLAEDVSLENWGVLAQLDIAAEVGRRRGASRRCAAGCWRIRSTSSTIASASAYAISEVLALGWAGRFDARARRADVAAQQRHALAAGTLACATRCSPSSRSRPGTPTSPGAPPAGRSARPPSGPATSRCSTRAAAGSRASSPPPSASCSATRCAAGARSRAPPIPEQRFAAIIGASGIDEERTPALMRGYARFFNEACRVGNIAAAQPRADRAELEVLKALPAGMTLATIATSLGKSKKTVERQVGNIYAKLHVANRAQAIQRARDLGIYA